MRHRGTLGGSLAHADPASDLPAACSRSAARSSCAGRAGERRGAGRPSSSPGFFETALEPDELLVEIRVPRTGVGGLGVREVHPAGERLGDRGRRRRRRPGGAGQHGRHVVRASATEEALARGASIAEAAALADQGTSPSADMHADADYRRHLARVLTRRPWRRAAAG